jgi:hypothetical protein
MSRVFSGSTTYLTMADHADFAPSTGMTVMCWQYHVSNSGDSHHYMVSKYLVYEMRITPASAGFRFKITASGGAKLVNSFLVPTLNQWYHVTGTYESTGGTVTLVVYNPVTGVRNKYTDTTSGTIVSGSNLTWVGRYQGGTSLAYRGRLCELKYWKDIALNDAEIDACRWGQNMYRGPKLYLPVYGAGSPEPDLSGGTAHPATVYVAGAADHAPIGPQWGFDSPFQFPAGAPSAGNAMPMAMDHYRRRRTG